jgi:hypothetical protein
MQLYVLIYAKFIRKVCPAREKRYRMAFRLGTQLALLPANIEPRAWETIKISITPAKWSANMKTGERLRR